MRSFFLFLIRNHVFFIFLLLELAALWLVFSNNRYQKSAFIHSANVVTGDVLNTYGDLTRYFYLKQENDSLLAENARLLAMMPDATMVDSAGSVAVLDSSGTMLYSYQPAQVINNTYTFPNNYITINKGSNHGIEKDMGVITSSGIVGIVKEVSPDFSVIISVLHGSFHTRVAVQKNNEQGRLVWDGKDSRVVKVVDVSEPGKLEVGDSIVTTRFSMAFPDGYPVGVLDSYGKVTGSNFYTLKVRLSTDFSRLRYVYVIDYLLKEQQMELELNNNSNVGN